MFKSRYPLYFAFLAIFTLALAACQSAAPVSESTEAEAVEEAPAEEPKEDASAEAPAVTPSVSVMDQEVADGTLTIAEVVSDGAGWIVIHAQADGKPGPILGFAPVAAGANSDVVVEVDAMGVTETVYAMLHTDAGEMGKFEFPGGPDAPVMVDDKVVLAPFAVASSSMASAEGALVKVAENMKFGAFLVDADGMTLYIFLNDEPDKSNCYDACAQNWPPLLSDGAPVAGEGVDGALLGTTERSDGGVQVTYKGWPLYYFAADAVAGDTNGQGIKDAWYVVGPDGEAITKTGGY